LKYGNNSAANRAKPLVDRHHRRMPPLSTHPVDVGQRSEAAILAAFVERGFEVLLPWGTNHRYDMVLDLGDRFLRVQCKTGRLRMAPSSSAP
jgi:PD-(D/E)XK nuclease superfamily protein